MRHLAAVLLLGFALSAVACSSNGSVLESDEPRLPDDVGIVTDSTLERIELDDERTYQLRDDVESFKTRSHAITALLSWEGKYVHIGLDDDNKVRWIAGIGTVSGDPKRVYYSGVFESFESPSRRLIFEDGTVLTLADDVNPPPGGGEIVCELDPVRDRVTRLT
jgi:hypothetical protein